MIETFISINNNEEVIQLPVPLEEYSVDSPFANQKVNGLKQNLNMIGLRDLKTVDFSSFFPIREYPFLQNRSLWGMEYIDILERWRDRRIPVRLIIVDNKKKKTINMAVTIDNFEWDVRQDGNINYSMSFTEFPFVDLRR